MKEKKNHMTKCEEKKGEEKLYIYLNDNTKTYYNISGESRGQDFCMSGINAKSLGKPLI